MVVDIFIPCFVDQLYPETGMNMVKVLEKVGCGVNYNPNQTCCGQPAFNSGHWDEAREVAEKFIRDFPNDRLIISPSGSCTGFVKQHYDEFFNNSGHHYECKQVQRNLTEITDFLVNKLKTTHIGSKFNGIVTVHDSCAAMRDYGLRNEPRELLKNIPGIEIREMKDSDVCCGFGGTFSVKFEPVSTAMAQQKIENAIATGAEYIVSTEASCLMHMDAYIRKHNLPIKTIHIVDILASGL